MSAHKVHVEFPGRIVFVGFGSIGQGVLPLILRHIGVAKDRITVVTADDAGLGAAREMGVKFIQEPLVRENFRRVLDPLAMRDTVYRPGGEHPDAIGQPGQFPYTRGIHESMYRGRLWTMRQFSGFGSAEDTNARYHYLLSQGQTGLSVAFDLPTQLGYDSDAPESEGEVGRVGVAIDSIADMEALFDGIPLDRVSTSMTINATAPILLAL